MLMVRKYIGSNFIDVLGVLRPFSKRVNCIRITDMIDSFFVANKIRGPPIQYHFYFHFRIVQLVRLNYLG